MRNFNLDFQDVVQKILTGIWFALGVALYQMISLQYVKLLPTIRVIGL